MVNNFLGFLPTFGPTFITFFGSAREYSVLSSHDNELNMGKTEGMAYRGRAFVEVLTKSGEHMEKPILPLTEQGLDSVQKYLRRKKYMLAVSFLSASMLNSSFGPVEFEVSIGNYGNKLDDTILPQPSSTPPAFPVSDGCSYFILPWNETKPCCVVESHWEDIKFRLEPINCFELVINKLEKNLNTVKSAIKHQCDTKTCIGFLLELLEELVKDCE